MKILMIGLTTPQEGGSQQHIYEISKRIGCDVLTQRGSICENKIEISNGEHIMFAIAVYWWALWNLFLCFKKEYDVIHIHENTLYSLAPLLAWRYKVVITVHGLRGFKFHDNGFLWPVFRAALSFADKIIAVSPADKEILDEFNLNPKYIPNGVDLSLYSEKKEICFNQIAFIGRVHPQKGIDLLAEAVPKNYLVVIGDDKNYYAEDLKKKYSEKEIVWAGKSNNRKGIAEILEESYMIVLPSRFEGLPLTLFESLASGRPTIVSDIPAFRSVVTDKEVLFFKSEDSEDLKRKIYKLLNDNILAENLGRAGKEFAKAYDWNVIANKTKEVYDL